MTVESARWAGADPLSFPLILGSWQTLELLDDGEGVDLLRAALDAGIRCFDVARYTPDNGGLTGDETATERAFARFSAAAGLGVEEVAISGKVWFDRWPEVSPPEEVQASLHRLGRERFDLVYLESLPGDAAGLGPQRAVEEAAALLELGLTESWGLGSWPAAATAEALAEAERIGLAAPAAFQQPYSVVWRSALESAEWRDLLSRHPVPVVASAPLAYGLLTGKYSGSAAQGRMAAVWSSERAEGLRDVVDAYAVLAARAGWDPTHLALAFALSAPAVGAVVFGARSADQLRHNVAALAHLDRLSSELRAELSALPSFG